MAQSTIQNFVISLFWYCLAILWIIAIVTVCAASLSGGGRNTALLFSASFLLLSYFTHLLLEICMWKRAELHILVALPAILIWVFAVLPTFEFLSIGIWLLVFCIAEWLALRTAAPLADCCAVPCKTECFYIPKKPQKDGVFSEMTQFRNEDGTESLEGVFSVFFAEKQRIAYLHVPFSPPFTQTPEICAEALDDADVSIKIGQTLPSGARIEIKRSISDAPDSHQIVVSATGPNNRC